MGGITGKGRNAVVTGVSSGIGLAIARELTARGFRVFGSVRREEDGARLSCELGPSFVPVVFDVTDAGAVGAAAAAVGAACGDEGLSGIVNNAGIAVAGPLLYVPDGDLMLQMAVNVGGVMSVTKAFFPLLVRARGAGLSPRIVNISSVSGRIASPFLGPYAASKHALEALSDSLRRELLMHGVDVIVVQPGRVETPIWGKSADIGPYTGTEYAAALASLREIVARRKGLLPARAVARTVANALVARRPRARYVVVSGRFGAWWLPRLLPDRWLDRLVAARLGIGRNPPRAVGRASEGMKELTTRR